jgi:acetate kinase
VSRDGDTVIAFDAGSSSVKFALYTSAEAPQRIASGQIEGVGASDGKRLHFAAYCHGNAVPEQELAAGANTHDDALRFILQWVERECGGRIAAAGHRVVLGGEDFTGPALIDDTVLAALTKLEPLAPLHQPHDLSAIRAISALQPALPQVACFDTAFHRSQPRIAQIYALPRALTAGGVKRYGFHGLSYEYISSVLPQFLGAAAGGRVIVAHLGNGASLCAMIDGKSIATTMGFSTLDGLVMGTRPGNLDPGVLLYLLRQGYDVARLEHMLYYESGLRGVSGLSSDMRELLASADPNAKEAIELFVYRIACEIGSLSAAAGGIDALVFTGGIGEHAASIREQVCKLSAWLGVAVDSRANNAGGPCISQRDSKVSAWVIPTDEESVIVRHTLATINA